MASGSKRTLTICGAAAALAAVLATAPRADEAATLAGLEVETLIAELDHARFTVRESAERRLVEVGEAALPALVAAGGSGTAERRHRARRALEQVRHRLLLDGFTRLARSSGDEPFDIEHGMWLVSRIGNPLVREEDLDARLDALAERVRERLAPVEPSGANPEIAVDALCEVLFLEEGFAGNESDYENPDNSSLERVLETRRGLPVLLSQVVLAVARRLDVPMVGLPLPRRYMVKYDGLRSPDGYSKLDIVVDPFGRGRTLTVDQLEDVMANLGTGFDPRGDLEPGEPRDDLVRILHNLEVHLKAAGERRRTAEVQDCLRVIESAP